MLLSRLAQSCNCPDISDHGSAETEGVRLQKDGPQYSVCTFDIIVKLWPGSCYVPLETLHRQRPALLSVNHLTYTSGTCSLLPSTSAVKTSLMWANQSWPSSNSAAAQALAQNCTRHEKSQTAAPSSSLTAAALVVEPCKANFTKPAVHCLPHTSKAVSR